MNYNLVHFTPVQKLGWSTSAYSIHDHFEFTDQLLPTPKESEYEKVINFSKKEKQEFKLNRLSSLLSDIRKNFGMFSIVDIVWNHTSSDTPWLIDHPEVGYNLENSPHLRPAYCLDLSLRNFSVSLESENLCIQSMEDIDELLERYKEQEFLNLNLLQFFTVDYQKTINDYLDYLQNPSINEEVVTPHDHHPFQTVFTTHCIHRNYKRNGSKVYRQCIVDIFDKERKKSNLSNEEICKSIKRAVDHYNAHCQLTFDADRRSIFTSLKNSLKYERLELANDRPISRSNPLVSPYFVTLKKADYGDNDEDKKKEMDGEDDIALAHSGWVWGMKASEDFAASNSKVYFTRQLIVWSDSVKLRYGSSPEDCPFLWNLMKEYTVSMASLFQGFRIDNCHTTPIHVAQYMIDAARTVQPELYVTAELFTDDAVMDIHYCETLGILSLIREAMQVNSPYEFSEKIHYYSDGLKNSLGSFETDFEILQHSAHSESGEACNILSTDPQKYSELNLKGSPMRSLFYDCTHDNKTPFEKRTLR